jgi:2-polyprenyl-3-methyl-5-hydroxy-6-metoxy-1,4-benzoquinol methylase
MSTINSLPRCPCCNNSPPANNPEREQEYRCAICGHQWRNPSFSLAEYYEKKIGRNSLPVAIRERKFADRLQDLLPLLYQNIRILEVGCAEGELGARVKQTMPVFYAGIELSDDAITATAAIDRVYRHPAVQLSGLENYDLLISFHVLEHIEDIETEVLAWKQLLSASPTGTLLVEVPNQAGHPWLQRDDNIEHLHQFTVASLCTLLHRCGFATDKVTTGHFESPTYTDSLRILARPIMHPDVRQQLLVQRIHSLHSLPWVIWGAGGDFMNYLYPVLDHLPIAAIVDKNLQMHGKIFGNHIVSAYDSRIHSNHPVLISSLRFRQDIQAHLLQLGVPISNIFGLEEIFDANNDI